MREQRLNEYNRKLVADIYNYSNSFVIVDHRSLKGVGNIFDDKKPPS